VVFLISYVPRGLSLSHEACRSSVELLQLLVYVFREVLRGVGVAISNLEGRWLKKVWNSEHFRFRTHSLACKVRDRYCAGSERSTSGASSVTLKQCSLFMEPRDKFSMSTGIIVDSTSKTIQRRQETITNVTQIIA